jgi:hypothetical protein
MREGGEGGGRKTEGEEGGEGGGGGRGGGKREKEHKRLFWFHGFIPEGGHRKRSFCFGMREERGEGSRRGVGRRGEGRGTNYFKYCLAHVVSADGEIVSFGMPSKFPQRKSNMAAWWIYFSEPRRNIPRLWRDIPKTEKYSSRDYPD